MKSGSVATDITWHNATVTREDRQQLNQHRSGVIWLTGLSGSGKSTLANALAQRLYELRVQSYVLDGDNVRHGLNKDLSFSPEDRQENIRRIGEVSKLFVDAGLFAITAFISPYKEDRALVRSLLEEQQFIEIYVRCSLEKCEERDPKGLYQKARKGEIPQFTGISAPYEEPEQPELVIDTEALEIESAVDTVISFLKEGGYIKG